MNDDAAAGAPSGAPGEDVLRYRRARAIFDQLRENDPQDWKAAVAELAGEDEDLARHALLLLAAHLEDPEFLDGPRQIGPYRILERLGEGGMGVVYRAEQQNPRREVALKVIGFRSPEILQRFAFEQQALALMNHPNIAQVFETGATDGRWPYLAMELIDGVPLNRYVAERDLPLRERIDLFVAICRGVEHAHRKGIIHRDLKPSNVLVSTQDGRPVPKIIDFGIAKALSESLAENGGRTRLGQQLGTPAYMGPEQRAGQPVDTRTDVYALGVILYELLASELPFAADTMGSERTGSGLARARGEPLRPSARVRESDRRGGLAAAAARRLARELEGDLDWIVLKALDDDPERRYPSANALAEDLLRHLRDEPTLARAPSRAYRLAKFVRRNRVALGVAAVVAAASLVGGASVWGARRAERERQREVERVEQMADAIVDLVDTTSPRTSRGKPIEARALLDRAVEQVLEQVEMSPRTAVRLRLRVGDAYRKLGDYESAEAQLVPAVALAESSIPGGEPLRLDALNALGNLYNVANEYARAAQIYERALPSATAVGSGSEVHAVLYKNLADCYARLGREDDAMGMLRQALAIDRRNGDEEGVYATLTSIGNIERQQNQLEAAVATLSEALALRTRLLDADDPALAYGYFERGRALLDAKRFAEARTDLETAFSIWSNALPEDHPNLAACLERLGRACWGAGDLASAEAHLRASLAIEERIAGDDPTHVIEALEVYRDFLAGTGRAAEAAEVGGRAERLDTARGGS
ncbi:MAG: tetratricopeptide repeat protein [Acidobacteria bacterium]|nr:tetratricopeptide repeat protein [Acidobacteriota bacterium]